MRILAAGILLVLSACQTSQPTVSLEEAKQITATVQQRVTAPPRTIGDVILEIYDPRYEGLAAHQTAQEYIA